MTKQISAACGLLIAVGLMVACSSDPEQMKREYVANGDRFLAEKKYPEAIVEYRNAIKQDARFGEARHKLAQAYEANGNLQTAFGEYVRAADLLPTDTALQLKAAAFLLLARQFEDAKTRAQLVLDREPKNIQAQLLFANAMAGLKDLTGAIREIEEAILLDPQRGTSYANLGLLQLELGKRDAARLQFERAVQIDPQSVPAWLALANFEFSSGGRARAEEALNKALALDPRNETTRRTLTALYMATGRAANAEPLLKEQVELTPDAAQPRLSLADFYFSMNRFEDAATVLRPIRGKADVYAEVEMRYAQLTYAAKQVARAHEMLDEVLKREPGNDRALVMKAQWLLVERKTSDALARATAVTTVNPQSAPGHYVRGQALLQANKARDAVKEFAAVLAINPRAVAAQIQLARLHLGGGSPKTALEHAEAAAKSAPESPEARAIFASALIATGDLRRAEPEVAALLKQFAGEAAAHVLSGDLLMAKENPGAARKAYEHALQLDPSSFDAFTGLTRVDITEKKLEAAAARVNARLDADPERSSLLLLSARVRAANRDFGGAEQALQRLLKIEPANRAANALLGQIYRSQGKLSEAVVVLDRITAQDPNDTDAHLMIAMILESQGKLADARKRYQQILAIDPRAAAAANNLAWLYADAGENLDEALRLAQSAVAEQPQNPDIRDTLGWVYFRKELPTLAIPEFEQSIKTNPKNPAYHYHLAAASAKAGERERARQSAQTALQLQPNLADAQRLLASLTR